MTPQHRLQTFLENLPRLLPEHRGEFAVVRDGHIDIYRTREEALAAGYRDYGLPSDFLVMQIEPADSTAKGN